MEVNETVCRSVFRSGAQQDGQIQKGLDYEDQNEMWTFNQLEDLGREARQAARMLARNPGHSLAIDPAGFWYWSQRRDVQLVNALFIRELPVHEPERLVALNPVGRQHSFSPVSGSRA